jgi:hypothetical protein
MNKHWYEQFDEHAMTAVVFAGDDDFDEGDDSHLPIVVPVVWSVCWTCDGNGRHVNPSIDGNGLSREDFEDDPDFAEDYRRGVYDVTCSECGGKRVSPALDRDRCDPRTLERAEKWFRDEADSRAEEEAERRMGC